MKCPNCSAEVSEKRLECEFCGHPFIDGIETQGVTPPSDSSGRAVFTASEPTYKAPEATYNPPPAPSDNPYNTSYPPATPPLSQSKPRTSYAAGHVPNYLVWAILATLCCCLPAGIVAIVYAAQVDGKLEAGDYAGAVAASDNAKMWSWISFGGALLILIPYFFLIFLGAAAEAGGL
jgi:Interferon-induced transmembrane protein